MARNAIKFGPYAKGITRRAVNARDPRTLTPRDQLGMSRCSKADRLSAHCGSWRNGTFPAWIDVQATFQLQASKRLQRIRRNIPSRRNLDLPGRVSLVPPGAL